VESLQIYVFSRKYGVAGDGAIRMVWWLGVP